MQRTTITVLRELVIWLGLFTANLLWSVLGNNEDGRIRVVVVLAVGILDALILVEAYRSGRDAGHIDGARGMAQFIITHYDVYERKGAADENAESEID